MQAFDKAQAKENFEQTAQNISSEDVKAAAESGSEKMDHLEKNIPKALLDYWQNLKEMISLLKDYFTGEYTTVPWKVISAVTAAVLYFVSPIDLLPDLIPVLGFLDDAFVLSMCISLCRTDLDNYRQYQKEKKSDSEASEEE